MAATGESLNEHAGELVTLKPSTTSGNVPGCLARALSEFIA
jgi:hypothetical protein